MKPYRLWYRFGWSSPGVFWNRSRLARVPFRLRMAWQRSRREFSDDQFWNLDDTLARLTVRGCRRLRDLKHGYPAELESWERWDAILARIEAGFQAWLDANGWFGNDAASEARFKDAVALYGEWFGALWD